MYVYIYNYIYLYIYSYIRNVHWAVHFDQNYHSAKQEPFKSAIEPQYIYIYIPEIVVVRIMAAKYNHENNTHMSHMYIV